MLSSHKFLFNLPLERSLQILGRAPEIKQFVKIGKKEGYTEIELKGPPGKPNLVIRRNLIATQKGSSFTLNGKSVSGKEISQKMAELNVQVGNLWYADLLLTRLQGAYLLVLAHFCPRTKSLPLLACLPRNF